MTGASSSRRLALGLGLVALFAFALRVFPFFGPDGAWSYRVDYDEGVYFAAAGWMREGLWPWRDFVFAHPPGQPLFLLSTSLLFKPLVGLSGAFALSRWLAAVLGALNTVWVGLIVSRFPRATMAASLLAAGVYATYSEVAQVERGPFIEPLLNFVCLAMTWFVVTANGRTSRVVAAAVLAGLASVVKLWAGLWVLGALFALPSWKERLRFSVVGGAVIAVLLAPFVFSAPAAFFEQVLWFQSARPPDGLIERLARAEQIVSVRHLASPLIALALVVLTLLRRASPPREFQGVLVTWSVTVAAFFASRAYWNQYNSHLVASEAVLVGLALCLVPRARGVLMVAVLITLGMATAHTVRRAGEATSEHFVIARSTVKQAPCVSSFEPSWLIAADLLPPKQTGPLIDPYAMQLLAAVRGGRRFPSSTEAFASQRTLPSGLETCGVIFVGERAERQLPLDVLRTTHHPSPDTPLIWLAN